MRFRIRVAALAAVVAACCISTARADPPALRLPLDCTPGADCWIANHVDLEPGAGTRDYSCGTLTYNGHEGTDFALRDLAAMREGMRVVAAAAGVVRGVRAQQALAHVESVKDRECGNGVRIDHGAGWYTLYCHLRRGSVTVKPGERVSAGQPLALVGLSGLTEYPHLHFSVRKEGAVVDPFRGEDPAGRCGSGARPLWDTATLRALPYAPGAIYNFGVAPRLPETEGVRDGRYRTRELNRDAEAIVVWVEVFGTAAGDTLRLRVEAPGGDGFFERSVALEKPQARVYRAFGRKRGAQPWPTGSYRVTIALDKPGGAAATPPAVHFSFDVR
ncbi:MAG: M23 family metallopeptidase [Candidatus Parcubacteria bacterium]|nr:M23 family metallopeptidase [Burkholderiales bacterium]